MQLIESIDLLAMRRVPDVHELGPADHHHCELNQWFKYRNVLPLTRDVRKELFAANIKTTVRRWIDASGYKIAMEGQTLSSGFTIDGICRTPAPENQWCLLVIEVLSHKSFKRTIKEGLSESQRVTFSGAMLASGELSKQGNTLSSAIVLVIDRDNFDMHTIKYNVEPEYCEVAEQQRIRVMESPVPPSGSKSYKCNWCDYKNHCEKNQVSMVNCRTCANSSVEGGAIVCEFGNKPCDKHLYHPALMEFAGYEFAAADQRNMIIEYSDFANVTEKGKRMDGKANMTSAEIYTAAGPCELIHDDVFIELMKRFDGRLRDASA